MAVNVGYVRLWRSIVDSDVFHDPWLLQLWIWCMVRANFRDQQFKGKTILRGSFVTSTERGADSLRVSKSKFWRGLKTLEKYGQIETKTETKITVVTVCNYSTYQDDEWTIETISETKVKRQRNESEMKLKQIEEGKKERKKEGKKKIPAPPVEVFPEDLDTNDFRNAWREWESYRREIKHPLVDTTIRQQLRWLSGLGHDRAVAAIHYTIRKQWRGLEEPGQANGGGYLNFTKTQTQKAPDL